MDRITLTCLVCTLALGCGGGGGASDSQCQGATQSALFADSGQYTRELYVNHDATSDDGDGSRDHPFRTLARASQGRAPGDRVHILAGTYFECIDLENVQGTAANPIAFTGEGEVRLLCDNGEAVAGNGVAYVVFEHLIVLSTSGDANAFHVDGGSHHVVLRNNEVAGVGAGGDCIKVNASDDIWILNNDLHNADTASGSAQGVDLVGVHRALVRGNHVHDIQNSQGMFAKGGSSDVTFEQNLVERITSPMSDAIGIVLGGVTDRQFFTPTDAAYEAANLIARNNIVIGADGGGIGAMGCHDCLIANNTLWNTGHTGYAIPLGPGATGQGAGDAVSNNVNLRVINNLVGNPDGTMRAPIQAEPAQRAGLSLSHNWWWNGERDDVFDPGYNHEVGVDEPNSHVEVDPQVVGPETNDVHLLPQSPARGAGVALPEVTDDYEGHCRSSPPNIGAL
jgi:hypothetical protein